MNSTVIKKRFFTVLSFAVILLIGLGACVPKNSSKESTSDDYSTGISRDTAESLAMQELLRHFKMMRPYSSVDLSQTRYKIASAIGSPSEGYTFKGKYYLYDQYGNYEEARDFSVKVDEDGTAHIYVW